MSIIELDKKLKNGEKVICPKCGGEWKMINKDVFECDKCNRRMIKHKRIDFKAP